MKEKQAFIFFVSDSPFEWGRNREIFLFYLNRISVNEDDQCEVILVEDVEYLDHFYDPEDTSEDSFTVELRSRFNWAMENNESTISDAFRFYENEVKKGYVSKLILLNVFA